MKEKNNILVVTPIYPGLDVPTGFTPVVHYFTKEWIKMGYNVRVIFLPSSFPRIYYSFTKPFRRLIETICGFTISQKPPKQTEFIWDKVPVYRIPMHKYRPHGRFSQKAVTTTIARIKEYLDNNFFSPNIIVGHWENPTLEILLQLKKIYHVPCSLVLHSDGSSLFQLYGEETKEIISSMDLLGFRSISNKEKFEKRFGHLGNSFLCYSGIPKNLLETFPVNRSFSSIHSFAFVGNLIRRKYPYETLKAVLQSNIKDFTFDFIGSGNESKKIERLLEKRPELRQWVKLHGRIPREKVVEKLRESDVFIMISKSEAFGLVYLEAMAKGCITIASKDEGFDGIIKHGENGFLCEAGNINELTKLINFIALLPSETLQKISQNAIETAHQMTDEDVAKDYIMNLGKTNAIKCDF